MIFGRFPWIWSPAAPPVVPPPPPPPPFWGKDTLGAMAWRTDSPQLLPRFQHLYPQESNIGWSKKEPI